MHTCGYYRPSSDQYGDAIDAFRSVLRRHPKNGVAWAFTGLSEFEEKRVDDALEALEKARAYGVGDNAELIALTRYTLACC
jgi:cytochrome c-type biogenesis protein CcmH/NrfG